jgi:hypothetical protein
MSTKNEMLRAVLRVTQDRYVDARVRDLKERQAQREAAAVEARADFIMHRADLLKAFADPSPTVTNPLLLKKIIMFADLLSDDAYDALSEDARKWLNDSVNCLNSDFYSEQSLPILGKPAPSEEEERAIVLKALSEGAG